MLRARLLISSTDGAIQTFQKANYPTWFFVALCLLEGLQCMKWWRQYQLFFRYAELLGESKELSLTKKMPRSKIVYLFTISLFGMFAIEFFMKVQLYFLPKRLWMQIHRFIFYMSSFAVKIFNSEHDVCCDCGVQVREADKYCWGSSQEWSALFLCVFVRLETNHCLALSLNHKGQPSIKTNHRKN